MLKHHYFYVVHFLSTSKGVGNQTINAARLPLAPHAPILPWLKKIVRRITFFPITFYFSFFFKFFHFKPSNLSFMFLIILVWELQRHTFFHSTFMTNICIGRCKKVFGIMNSGVRVPSIWRPLQSDNCLIFILSPEPFGTFYMYLYLFVMYANRFFLFFQVVN